MEIRSDRLFLHKQSPKTPLYFLQAFRRIKYKGVFMQAFQQSCVPLKYLFTMSERTFAIQAFHHISSNCVKARTFSTVVGTSADASDSTESIKASSPVP